VTYSPPVERVGNVAPAAGPKAMVAPCRVPGLSTGDAGPASTSTVTRQPTWRRLRAASKRCVRPLLLVLTLAVLVADGVLGGPYLGHALKVVGHPGLGWLTVALGAQLVSLYAAAGLQRRMLLAGSLRVSRWRMTALAYAGNALSGTLPAGSVLSVGYTFRRLRAWGASAPLATFSLLASGVLSTVAFASLGVVAAWSTGTVGRVPALLGVGGFVGAGAALRRLAGRPQAVGDLGGRVLRRAGLMLRRDTTAEQGWLDRTIDQLTAIRPRRRDWAAGLGYAFLNWTADLACLVAASRAIGGHGIALTTVAVAYVAGMSVSSLSPLPGGLGLVDTAMIVALSQGGTSVATATAAVLLFRLVSFVLVVLVGWAVLGVARGRHRVPRRSPVSRPVPVVPVPVPALPATAFAGGAAVAPRFMLPLTPTRSPSTPLNVRDPERLLLAPFRRADEWPLAPELLPVRATL